MSTKLILISIVFYLTLSAARPNEFSTDAKTFLSQLCAIDGDQTMSMIMEKMFECKAELMPVIFKFGQDCYADVYGLDGFSANMVKVAVCKGGEEKVLQLEMCVNTKAEKFGHQSMNEKEYWDVIKVSVTTCTTR